MDSQSQSSTTLIPPYAPDHLSDPAPVALSRGVKRERSIPPETGFEEEEEEEEEEAVESGRPSKKLKTDTSTVLSEENLRKFEEYNMSTMYPIKRTLSRRSTAKSETTQDSQGSKNINPSIYRFQHLAAAGISINSNPPDDIKATIDAIIGRKPTLERLETLKRIAKDFHARSNELISASDSEDDSVRVLIQALQAIKPKTLRYQEKAEWREELKPQPPQQLFNADFLRDSPPVSDASDEPRKRQQLSTDKPPPSETSQAEPPDISNTMPPPAYSFIKTPRPDISIGIDMTDISARLAPRLGTVKANALLPWLQNETKPLSKRAEPLLISVPTPRASNIAFVFAVGEGKAYSTGRPVFEAQNQAAVAGASALKIQRDLQRLTQLAKPRTGDAAAAAASSSSPPPRALPLLFFSVCTEGPTHELWAHYTQGEDGVPTYGSKVQKICHGDLLDTVESFLIAFDNVCAWGTGEFLDIVVENLEIVASAATAK